MSRPVNAAVIAKGFARRQLAPLVLACALAAGAAASTPGTDSNTPTKRWITGSQVNLRVQPALDAEVLRRLAVDTSVDLLESLPGGQFCKVTVAAKDGAAVPGFVACRYLGAQALAALPVEPPFLESGQPNPNFDHQKAFWLAPSHEALTAYGQYLERKHLTQQQREDVSLARPQDAEFERMKAHLAKGIFGPVSQPYLAWDNVKRAAVIPAKGNAESSADLVKAARPAYPFQSVLGTYDIDAEKTLALVRALELPTIQNSLFQSMDALAPPTDLAEQASGRFQMVHTIQTRGREVGKGAEKWTVSGRWDIGQVSKSLTRAITKNVLYRDGKLTASATHLKRSFFEWGDTDGPMCEGYSDGYAYGDSDPKIWSGYGFANSDYEQSLQRNPKGSLLSFYTRSPLPQQQAAVSTQSHALDRESTGFVSATSFYFDLDGDGVSDMAVWEGRGRAQGHLGGAPSTDDAYQRIFFANIKGRWHVLGSDRFSYGCGC